VNPRQAKIHLVACAVKRSFDTKETKDDCLKRQGMR